MMLIASFVDLPYISSCLGFGAIACGHDQIREKNLKLLLPTAKIIL